MLLILFYSITKIKTSENLRHVLSTHLRRILYVIFGTHFLPHLTVAKNNNGKNERAISLFLSFLYFQYAISFFFTSNYAMK